MKIIEYEGIKYYVGKNAKENWELLDSAKKENENYIWFHLNSFPSCYVIMYLEIDKIDKTCINKYLEYGALLCKENTKYKNCPNIKIVYTKLKKLTKTNKEGEVIISGKRNLILLNNLNFN